LGENLTGRPDAPGYSMKRKRIDRKKRSLARPRDWESLADTAFSRDLSRHRRALAKLPEASVQRALATLPERFTPNGVVISHTKKWAFVQFYTPPEGAEGRWEHLCLVDERLPEGEESLLAPGDEVYVEREGDELVVRGIAPRRTRLARLAGPHERVRVQVLAANADLLAIVASTTHPPFRPGLIDRFLIAATAGGVSPVLVVNKLDLAPMPPEAKLIYEPIGVPVIGTSCVTGEGIQELASHLRGRTCVLAGHSGVGKSSLLSALDPNLRVITQEVTPDGRGRHTTTLARLYVLREDIRVIDTPGIRALGLWNITPEAVMFYYPEIAEHAVSCRFRNCTHTHEPSCAVKAAVSEGKIPELRYASYRRVLASLASEEQITPGRTRPRES